MAKTSSAATDAGDQKSQSSAIVTVGTKDEIETAKAKRAEIDATLAKLRAPGLAILPDHFVWQRVPQALLERDPLWTSPYPTRYELVAGGGTYQITPRWRTDLLVDLKAAIDTSGAPVTTTIEKAGTDIVLIASEPVELHLCAERYVNDCQTHNLATPLVDVAEVRLALRESWWPPNKQRSNEPQPKGQNARNVQEIDRSTNPVVFILGDDKPEELKFKATQKTLFEELWKQIADKKLKVSKRDDQSSEKMLVLTAADPRVRDIRLLWQADDPFSNVLTEPVRRPWGWRVSGNQLQELTSETLILRVGQSSEIKVTNNAWTSSGASPADPKALVNAAGLVRTINDAQHIMQHIMYKAKVHQADTLVLTSSRLGPIELRSQTGRAETNILNPEVEGSLDLGAILFQRSMLGVIVSWALLSLGAPFWYDMLKNLLKLRPAPAIAEEAQRKDRTAPGSDAAAEAAAKK